MLNTICTIFLFVALLALAKRATKNLKYLLRKEKNIYKKSFKNKNHERH
jgi:hypothetical protein